MKSPFKVAITAILATVIGSTSGASQTPTPTPTPTWPAPPAGDGNWYFCVPERAYYPWVQTCTARWRPDKALGTTELPPEPAPPPWVFALHQEAMWKIEVDQTIAEYQGELQQHTRMMAAQQDANALAIRERAQRARDQSAGIKYLSITDFELDKGTLSRRVPVLIKGVLVSEGAVQWLTESPMLPSAPTIPVLSDGAPRTVRALLLRCRMSQMCVITLLGYVTDCKETFMGAPYKSDQCLRVTDVR